MEFMHGFVGVGALVVSFFLMREKSKKLKIISLNFSIVAKLKAAREQANLPGEDASKVYAQVVSEILRQFK